MSSAASGSRHQRPLPAAIDQAAAYKAAKDGKVVIMRHSQGDHWDLMLLEPAGEHPLSAPEFEALADLEHSFLATSDSTWEEIAKRSKPSDLFHVEMFYAAAGKGEALVEQREMENVYCFSSPSSLLPSTLE